MLTKCFFPLNVIRRLNSSFQGCYDILVVGGGIVGVATARELLLRNNNLKIAVIEKESKLGCHQSGHNSGVIHAGIYYLPGSQRAELCTEGMKLAYQYFNDYNIPYKKVGKLIVATDESEVEKLDELYIRGQQNGVPDMKMLCQEEICCYEPYCKGVKAIHSPHTGIVDWEEVTISFGNNFEFMGGKIIYDFEVCKMDVVPESTNDTPDVNYYPVSLFSSTGQSVSTAYVLCCGGLYSDKLAALSGGSQDPPIIPIRGEYLLLKEEKTCMINGNIYPVPDPRFPFLGVHFTPRMDGSVWVGPNAIFATAREGYRYSNVNVKELSESIRYRGFQRLVWKYWGFGVNELMKSLSLNLAVKDLRKFIPDLQPTDLERGPTGVRAQALNSSGELIEDFVFEEGHGLAASRVLHCRNAPSPAATSSLAIARVLADKMYSMMCNQ